MADVVGSIGGVWRALPTLVQALVVLVVAAHLVALVLPGRASGPTGPDVAYEGSTFPVLRGVRTHVLEFDPADHGWDEAPRGTVVAHHHFYGAAATFTRLGEELAADGWTVLAIDRTGFGLTDRPDPAGRWTGPDAPYTRAFTIEQTVELLDQRGVDRAVWLGTSMGGTTVLEAALAHPERVALAVPVAAPLRYDASLPGFARPVLRSWAGTRIGAAFVRLLSTPVDAERVGSAWADPAAVDEVDVDAHARFLGLDGYDVGVWWRMTSDRRPQLHERLDELAATGVPVRPVAGALDRTVPPSTSAAVAAAVGVEHVELPCGHVVHAECPAGLARIVSDAAAGVLDPTG